MSGAARAAPTRVAIIGSGFSGLGIAVALRRAGIEFTLFERRGQLGGTWWDNTYPGCKCDVPSHLYSFSFAPNPDWSYTYSTQAEIWAYLKQIAERYQILPHVRFEHDVLDATWDDDEWCWQIETTRGPWTADVLISAVGALSEPSIPSLRGLNAYRGTSFHSAAWDHRHELAGQRVAVIGTGSSAIQFVPRIQPRVARLYVFQRTAPWVLPHNDRPISPAKRAVYRRLPWLQKIVRARTYVSHELVALALTKYPRLTGGVAWLARRHMQHQVADPALRAKLLPPYLPGCKRLLLSNDYYPAIQQANVELVTEAIDEVRTRSIVTCDGREREVDTIIFGTGFKVSDHPSAERIRGRGGQSLARAWGGRGPRAHRGTTVPGFPNLLLMTGPNTGIGHTSLVLMIEAQMTYITQCLRHMADARAVSFEVRREPFEIFNAELQRRMKRTVWTSGGCRSWYLDEQGRNSTLWPDFTWKYWWLMRRFDAEAYEWRQPRTQSVEPVARPDGTRG